MAKNYFFTSESVCAGHPDKICDAISDQILDQVLATDPNGRVAVETLATFDKLIIAGEVTCQGVVDFESIARSKIESLGYTDPIFHFSNKSSIEVLVHKQSLEIAVGVDQAGAGDQGMMFGFACHETDNLMPLPISLAHALVEAIDTARETKLIDYLRPDGKSQVTVEYRNNRPARVSKIVLAVPHRENIALSQVKEDLFNKVVIPVLTSFGFSIKINDLIVNGTGIWHIGGPAFDSGLTGRKIVVDTYGGYARVGGGAFSGKDPSKVDRSGAYAARFIAKNIVAQKLADKVEVYIAYFIGAKTPVMFEIETFGTEKRSLRFIKSFADNLINLSVSGIIKRLNLQRPIYSETSSYGHFGKPQFPWEELV